jgi:N-acetylmuramoyl-L-alanine amidase
MSAGELLDRFMIALCVWREARGETRRGKMLVASVIRNRVDDRRWPDSYSGVVTQPLQFSCFNAGDPNAVLYPRATDPSWIDAVDAAQVVMSDGVLTKANHYHVVGLKPKWADASKAVANEGHHVFYEL